jgi:hypothetical protein
MSTVYRFDMVGGIPSALIIRRNRAAPTQNFKPLIKYGFSYPAPRTGMAQTLLK